MSLVAGDIIEQAKLQAHPVGFLKQVSPTQLLAHLSNLDNDFVALVNQIMPSLLSDVGDELTVSSTLNQVGYDLENAMGYTDFKYTDSQDRVWEVVIVAEVDFLAPSRHPAAMIVQGVGNSRLLLPADPMGKAWAGTEERTYWKAGDKVSYRYIPLPTRLTKLTDELLSPDFAMSWMVQSTAQLILQMMGAAPVDVEAAAQREQSYYRTLIMQLYKQARIHTPNQVTEDTFYTHESLDVITR